MEKNYKFYFFSRFLGEFFYPYNFMPKNQIKNLNNFISDHFSPDYGKQ